MTTEFILQTYVLPIVLVFLLAWVIHRFSNRIVNRLLGLNKLAPRGFRFREERKHTLHGLFSSVVSSLGFGFAIIYSLSLFIDASALIWMLGLFSAGFGFGAKPLISDYLTGVNFIFEAHYDVGEKVVIMDVEGVVEAINLRTTILRAPSGEVYVVPNGEVRLIRNFSRGRFSVADITIKVHAQDLEQTLNELEALGKDAVQLLPNLLEPWKIISESGQVGEYAELKLACKARFGTAADLKPRLLALVQKHLHEIEIPLV